MLSPVVIRSRPLIRVNLDLVLIELLTYLFIRFLWSCHMGLCPLHLIRCHKCVDLGVFMEIVKGVVSELHILSRFQIHQRPKEITVKFLFSALAIYPGMHIFE